MSIAVAILGAGRIGTVHADAISTIPNARLVAIADPREDAAAAVATAHGCAVRTIDEIEVSPDVDAVIICTPTDTHADLIERFARAGKAIFCEKPIDLDLDRVGKCIEVVRKQGAILMVGFNRRFDPHFRAVRRAIDEGRIGEVEMLQIVSRDPAPPPTDYIRSSGGILRDMTIHDFDMARFLLREEPESVFAVGTSLVDPRIGAVGDHDSVSVVLTTASGRHCSISNSRRAVYGYDQRIEVHGSMGMVSAENQRPVAIEIATGQGFTRPPLHDFFMTRYAQAYAAEMAAFVAGVSAGEPVTPSADDGFRALALAEAAIRSIAEGRKVGVSEILAGRA